MRRIAIALILAGALVTSGCDEDDDLLTGSFDVAVFETNDTCDGTPNGFQAELTIERTGDNQFVVEFGEEAVLDGSVQDGILVATGTSNAGGIEAQMRIFLRLRPETVDGEGDLTFDGTFPGVDGVCVQEFNLSGDRLNLAPTLPTQSTRAGGARIARG